MKALVNSAKVFARQFALTCPQRAKMDVLSRDAPASVDWVETGTCRGTITKFLSRFGKSVSSLEPSTHFFRKAIERFKNNVIARHAENFHDVYRFSHDLRCFFPFQRDNYGDYPGIQVVADWAKKMGCKYLFDRDIMVLTEHKDARRG